MFGQKYHKQLQKLLPFLEQNDQIQTFNKINENDEQGSECFTPNYNVIQQDEDKKTQQYNPEPHEEVSCENENSNYEQMRQNLNIDYETFFTRNGLFSNNQNVGPNSATSIIIKQQKNTLEKYDFCEFDSSFKNLIDSNYHKNDENNVKKMVSLKNEDIKNAQSLKKQNIKDHKINNKDFTKAILSKDPQIRKKYLRQFIAQQNSQIQMKNESSSQRQNFEQNQNIIQIKDDLKFEDEKKMSSVLKKVQNEIKIQESPKVNFNYLQSKVSHNNNEIYLKSQKSIYKFEKMVDRKIREENLKFAKCRRILFSSMQQNYQKSLQNCSRIKDRAQNLQKEQNHSIQKVKIEIDHQFQTIQQSILKLQRKIDDQETYFKGQIDKLIYQTMELLNQQISEAKQNQKLLLEMLDGLLNKLY